MTQYEELSNNPKAWKVQAEKNLAVAKKQEAEKMQQGYTFKEAKHTPRAVIFTK